MKKLFFVIIAIGALSSCEKLNWFHGKEEKSNPCPTVNSDAVPATITDAFKLKYPADSVTTWYNVDGTAFCAQFTVNGVVTYAHFANDGTFQAENSPTGESDSLDQKGNHQDNTCDCGNESGNESDNEN